MRNALNRAAIIPTFLLLLGSIVLGATVFREPIAKAAGLAGSAPVTVSNTSTNPVPTREQNNDASGNIKVHEQGTANVKVTNDTTIPVHELGVVATFPTVAPGASFSFQTVGVSVAIGCGENLPAGTRWFISSVGATNVSDQSGDRDGVAVVIFNDGANGKHAITVTVKAGDTAQLTFPQPFVFTSTDAGACITGTTTPGVLVTLVGYRQ